MVSRLFFLTLEVVFLVYRGPPWERARVTLIGAIVVRRSRRSRPRCNFYS